MQAASDTARRQEEDLKWEALLRDKEAVMEEQRTKLTEAQKELERLRVENQSLTERLGAAQAAASEELEEQRRKNNELRDKNYKAMDALAAAEKALVDMKKAAATAAAGNSPTDIQRSIGNGLKRAFPELTFDPAASPVTFADVLARQLAESVERLQREEQTKAASQVNRRPVLLNSSKIKARSCVT